MKFNSYFAVEYPSFKEILHFTGINLHLINVLDKNRIKISGGGGFTGPIVLATGCST